MEKTVLKLMPDEKLQEIEDTINEIQAERRAVSSANPIDAEREALVKGVGQFFKKLKGCDSLADMWR